MRIGTIVMRKPVYTYFKPSPCTTVSQKPAPALMPTEARNKASPNSRNIMFAEVVVYVTRCIR